MAVLSFPNRKTVSIISSKISACLPSSDFSHKTLDPGVLHSFFHNKTCAGSLANRPSLSGSR